ncbi:MAG: hypothetical protein B0D92_01840 [Spirochaeta sp. LUC14_002_19_P3]|nr:MAG: hypothetical protein B0D92_01840 [Spirochaeta sp. LUC14_002_19_P3]
MNIPKNSRMEAELTVLYRISKRMARQHDVSSLIHDVLDILETEIGFSYAAFALRHPNRDEFAIEAARGTPGHEQPNAVFAIGEGISGQTAQSMEASLHPGGDRSGQTALLCVPVIHQRMAIGTITIEHPGAPEDELQHELRFLNLVSDILAEGVSRIREDIEEREILMEENRSLHKKLSSRSQPDDMVGSCGGMREVYNQIAQVADSQATVLIRGESGTGKEMVARAIHHGSTRRGRPFVAVNCAALPEGLIESELFGHEKGAFTGAAETRKGRFEQASGGTLFLDEIGDISPAVQVRLLRALQERCIDRIGGTAPIPINVRIVAATNRNLEEAIANNSFRDDLYYRLNVFPIHIPPLRSRRSDIITLADHFIQKYNTVYSKKIRRVSTAAINMMTSYHWPGNVRELENCIERAVLISQDDVIHGYSLPPSLQTADQTNTPLIPREGASLHTMLDSYEREIIIDALKKRRGNAAAASQDLQTTPRIMNYAIKRLGINAAMYRK